MSKAPMRRCGDMLDDYSYVLHQMGTATTLPAEPEDEVIKRLHEAVADVTGRAVEPPAKRRIGFLP